MATSPQRISPGIGFLHSLHLEQSSGIEPLDERESVLMPSTVPRGLKIVTPPPGPGSPSSLRVFESTVAPSGL